MKLFKIETRKSGVEYFADKMAAKRRRNSLRERELPAACAEMKRAGWRGSKIESEARRHIAANSAIVVSRGPEHWRGESHHGY